MKKAYVLPKKRSIVNKCINSSLSDHAAFGWSVLRICHDQLEYEWNLSRDSTRMSLSIYTVYLLQKEGFETTLR